MSSPLRALRSRPIRFQLTSLMDLLLIIVFAQFLDFERSRRDAAVERQQAIEQARASLQSTFEQKQQELESVEQALAEQREQLRDQTREAVIDAQEAKRRQAFTEDLVKRLLKVDETLLDPDLSPPESAATIEQARKRAEQIQQSNPTRMLRFLAGYDELLKRAEVWTVHVSDRGLTELQPGADEGQTQQFRLEASSQSARADEFVQQFRAAYSQISQPKGLVIILVSFSPRAVAGNYQPVIDAMPEVIEWLETDSGERTQFEYAVLGAITDPARDLPRNSAASDAADGLSSSETAGE